MLQSFQGKVPDNMDVVEGRGEEPGKQVFYLVRREAVITGRDLKNARGGVGQNNEPDVHFSLNPAGAERFSRETGRSVGRRLAIILDGRVESAPTIQSQISGEGVITGRYTLQPKPTSSPRCCARAPCPATLKFQQELTVGASLGKDSIRSGVLASAAGMLFLALFMIGYYKLSGLNAIVALALNLVILLGAMAYIARHPDAARDRRRDPHDRRRRRHERARLRAHPRGAAGTARR